MALGETSPPGVVGGGRRRSESERTPKPPFAGILEPGAKGLKPPKSSESESFSSGSGEKRGELGRAEPAVTVRRGGLDSMGERFRSRCRTKATEPVARFDRASKRVDLFIAVLLDSASSATLLFLFPSTLRLDVEGTRH